MINRLAHIETAYYTPNYWPTRSGNVIEAVIVHRSQGTLKSCISWFGSTVSQVSAHAFIDFDGKLYQFVVPEEAAWACGVEVTPTWPGIHPGINPNLYTYNIEVAGISETPMTNAQFNTLNRHIADVMSYYKLQPDSQTIAFHHEIDSAKDCPGTNIWKWPIIGMVKIYMLAVKAGVM